MYLEGLRTFYQLSIDGCGSAREDEGGKILVNRTSINRIDHINKGVPVTPTQVRPSDWLAPFRAQLGHLKRVSNFSL